MAMQDIGTAAKLPLAVAIEVVAQGIRIRLGRSLVTLAGVVCGIAFLASVLTASVVKRGVADEQTARAEAVRMLALLESESGPVKGRRLAVLAAAAPDPAERRLLTLIAAGGGELAWSGVGAPAGTTTVDAAAAADGASATLLIGVAPADLAQVLLRARQPVLAALAPPSLDGIRPVALAWTPKPDEEEARAAQAAQERVRSWWVTGIALAVTMIGIANAMLMSVTERFREIGTMKCLGALSSFIRRLFFLESAFIGLVGGIAGMLLGALITLLGYGASFGFGLVFGGCAWGELSVLLLIGTVASVVLAVGAAIYPATVASRMRPANALRSSV
jgi:putative ABC transport system permease protein